MARLDAIREGDGPAMMEHWAFDLIQFFNLGHFKYAKLAHNMLMGMYLIIDALRTLVFSGLFILLPILN